MKQNFFKKLKKFTRSTKNFFALILLISISTFNLTAADTEIYGKIMILLLRNHN